MVTLMAPSWNQIADWLADFQQVAVVAGSDGQLEVDTS